MALVAGLAVAAGLAYAAGKPSVSGLSVQPIEIKAQPIASFDKSDPRRTRFGMLEWRGGLVLSSDQANFGGWSGLAFDPDGRRFVAVSDAGAWMTAELAYDAGRPKGLASASIGPLKSRDGKSLTRGRDRDAEAVVLDAGSLEKGELLVAFEQNDRIGRFAVDGNGVAQPSSYIAMPAEAKAMKIDGFEAVAKLAGGPLEGSIVAFSEHSLKGEKRHAGWIWISGEPKRFTLDETAGFDVTDAAGLADGSLLVLERRFRWSEGVKMRLRRITAAELKPGSIVKGELLLEADLNQEIDNMEGLAVHKGAGGETLLTLLSDDNFNGLFQRTVLLEFALAADGATTDPNKHVETRPPGP